MRTIGLGILAGLILLPSWAGARQEKEDPRAIEGAWEAPASYAGRDGEPKQTLSFKDGRMVWSQPRQTGDREKRTGFRLEADYTVSKTGRVYGMITLAGGSAKADEGDTFSFRPAIKEGYLTWEDVRGTAHLESKADKISWRR